MTRPHSDEFYDSTTSQLQYSTDINNGPFLLTIKRRYEVLKSLQERGNDGEMSDKKFSIPPETRLARLMTDVCGDEVGQHRDRYLGRDGALRMDVAMLKIAEYLADQPTHKYNYSLDTFTMGRAVEIGLKTAIRFLAPGADIASEIRDAEKHKDYWVPDYKGEDVNHKTTYKQKFEEIFENIRNLTGADLSAQYSESFRQRRDELLEAQLAGVNAEVANNIFPEALLPDLQGRFGYWSEYSRALGEIMKKFDFASECQVMDETHSELHETEERVSVAIATNERNLHEEVVAQPLPQAEVRRVGDLVYVEAEVIPSAPRMPENNGVDDLPQVPNHPVYVLPQAPDHHINIRATAKPVTGKTPTRG